MNILSLRKIEKRVLAWCFLLISSGLIQPGQLKAQDQSIQWYSMQEAQQRAKKTKKKVLVFAQASWCVYCKKMREEVFPNQAVIDSMNTYFYAVNIDVESNKPMIYNGTKITQQEFAQRNRVRATPTTFFINNEGKRLGAQPGFIPPETFSQLLGFVGSDAFKRMEFKSYLKKFAQK